MEFNKYDENDENDNDLKERTLQIEFDRLVEREDIVMSRKHKVVYKDYNLGKVVVLYYNYPNDELYYDIIVMNWDKNKQVKYGGVTYYIENNYLINGNWIKDYEPLQSFMYPDNLEE